MGLDGLDQNGMGPDGLDQDCIGLGLDQHTPDGTGLGGLDQYGDFTVR